MTRWLGRVAHFKGRVNRLTARKDQNGPDSRRVLAALAPERDDRQMDTRVALDLDVFSRVLSALSWNGGPHPDPESVAAVRIYFYLANPLITPTVAGEIEQRNVTAEIVWRNYHFAEIVDPDDFYRGCVKGMSQRYVDYHPDPRDCRVVAEAECAKVEALLTLNAELMRGIRGRAEALEVMRPSEYWAREQVQRGAPLRIEPRAENPLARAAWWRW